MARTLLAEPQFRPRVTGVDQDIAHRAGPPDGLAQEQAGLTAAGRLQDELWGLVAHELRNPLTTILVAVRRLQIPGLVVPEEAETVDAAYKNAARLAVLLDNMLTLARADKPVELEPLLLQRVLPAVIENHRTLFPARPVVVELPSDLPVVIGHAGWVAQVVENFLENAEKYSASDALLVISGAVERDAVAIRVLDRGNGIDAARASQLFEPFHREESAKGVPGLGLGLAVCKRLIEQQAGQIWARPRPEGGSEFGFSLRTAG